MGAYDAQSGEGESCSRARPALLIVQISLQTICLLCEKSRKCRDHLAALTAKAPSLIVTLYIFPFLTLIFRNPTPESLSIRVAKTKDRPASWHVAINP